MLSKPNHILKIQKTKIRSRLGRLSIDFPASQATAMRVQTVLQVALTKVYLMQEQNKIPLDSVEKKN